MFFRIKPKIRTDIITDIEVLSPKNFEKTVKGFREVAEFPDYKVTDGVASKEPKVTYCAETCAILGMSNGIDTYIGHYAPEIRKADFNDKLDYIIKKFQDATGRISAIITGGHDGGRINPIYKSKASFEQLSDIGEILDKNNVNMVTKIAGKKENTLFVDNLAVTKDKFILAPISYKNTDPINLKTTPTKEELQAILTNRYSIVKINPQHNICYKK